jgi:hypothetical protein
MYTLNVTNTNLDFNLFLTNEATFSNDTTYSFADISSASKIISRYILYFLRESSIKQLIKRKTLDPNKKDDFLLHLSSEDIIDILRAINEKVSLFLSNTDIFHLEGFIHFRLNKEMNDLKLILQNTLKEFYSYNHSDTNLSSLEDILKEQPSKEPEMFILVEPKHKIILRSQDKVYLVEHARNEDMILSHLVILAPNNVKVHETYGEVKKETAIILKKLFKDKVAFTHDEFRSSKDL